ncbi:helix-turn-helix domain-containing protein [Oryzomonas rubra]|uniref:XRE family transcriptional regulator n=1 Tax=Oryzomonas rubra TaxID=2509454 RepID=A0A5A9XRK9_9BACT|nr:helix-turn-helix transcriptional regulator [Oryzomonas rubra]KAA0894251.1 XRE family transcriptional regulator [Oryzomonas rubra]
MKTTKVLLGERIRELRKKRQMSQEQLAEKIQIAAKNLSRIEVGQGYPSLDTLEKISLVLSVEMRDFFDFQHLESAESISASLKSIIDSASEEELKMSIKMIKALIR